ncbi:MAG: isoprenylcysteine carboxylmethyltransferase family protein [Candidatus Bathyarchaeota archaeon]|nr:isoprenylcysteine carboxylmethyltransferase family protein [Candidatus Bathyarchaeota archaeon]
MALTSVILVTGLAVFWGVSLRNVLKHRGIGVRNQSETPLSLGFILALIGSLSLFAESLALIALERTDNIYIMIGVPQIIGLSLFFIGCLLHAWSVVVRERYATSWSMREDHKLITEPPYSLVRHPSYLAYMLMIIGITLVWLKWFTLLPWVAIPGYVMVSRREEELLIERFGDQYREYMKQVGAFIPRL